MAVTLDVPVGEAIQILTYNYKSYIPPPGIAGTNASAGAEVKAEGKLNTNGTVNTYIVAVIKLWRVQVAYGGKNIQNACVRNTALWNFWNC